MYGDQVLADNAEVPVTAAVVTLVVLPEEPSSRSPFAMYDDSDDDSPLPPRSDNAVRSRVGGNKGKKVAHKNSGTRTTSLSYNA